jgi:DNA-binding winged helix-turn-helix (wHTH) protein
MRFGDFELDCATAELYKNGRRLKLQDQPARLLVLLASRAGTLVTRADIQETLWADGQFVEFEHAINVAVKKIREALDDDPLKPRFVETVPKKGYRFIGAIDAVPAQPAQSVSVATESSVHDEQILEREFALPAARAGILFIAVQAVYLTIYGLALLHIHDVAAVLGEAGIPWLAVPVLVGAAASIPVRLYLIFTVGLGHPAAGMKYRRMLPYLMPWDWLWAPSPFLAVQAIGAEWALVMSILLAYPPISQLILMRSIDHPKNRRHRQSAAVDNTVTNRR